MYAWALCGRCHGTNYICFSDSKSFGWCAAGRPIILCPYFIIFFLSVNLFIYVIYLLYIFSALWQDDFMNFIIMFMASPNYIRNPYLRAKMVEVLNCWMPRRRFFYVFQCLRNKSFYVCFRIFMLSFLYLQLLCIACAVVHLLLLVYLKAINCLLSILWETFWSSMLTLSSLVLILRRVTINF